VRNKRLTSGLVLLLITCVASAASADLPRKVMQKFNGRLIVTTDSALSTSYESDAEMIKAIDKANVKVLKSYEGGEGVAVWSFYFMAFMSQSPRTTALSLDFYMVEGSKKTYVANKRLTGVDSKLRLLSTRVELSEDDNLNKGRTYEVRLTAKRGKREVILAKTTLKTK
jgi:hypothetical protein